MKARSGCRSPRASPVQGAQAGCTCTPRSPPVATTGIVQTTSPVILPIMHPDTSPRHDYAAACAHEAKHRWRFPIAYTLLVVLKVLPTRAFLAVGRRLEVWVFGRRVSDV